MDAASQSWHEKFGAVSTICPTPKKKHARKNYLSVHCQTQLPIFGCTQTCNYATPQNGQFSIGISPLQQISFGSSAKFSIEYSCPGPPWPRQHSSGPHIENAKTLAPIRFKKGIPEMVRPHG